jgi:hypothetical protein
LRVSLLILTIIVLLIVSSSLTKGTEAARRIDTTFCGYLVENHNAQWTSLNKRMEEFLPRRYGPPTWSQMLQTKEDECQVGHSRTWVEITRNTDEELPWESTPGPGMEFIAAAAADKKAAFERYDIQRNEAYQIDIQLSAESGSSTVKVNALTVAKIVPFCVLIVFAIIALLGFQQAEYKRQLQAQLEMGPAADLPNAIVETQFLAVPSSSSRRTLGSFFELSPTELAVRSLVVAAILLLFQIVSAFTLTLVQLTNSVILNYQFGLSACVAIFVSALVITRKSYMRSLGRFPQAADGDDPSFSPIGRWLTLVIASIACLSLAAPWAVETSLDPEDRFRGFEFLTSQRPTGKFFNYTTYQLSPPIFRDVRIIVCIAVAFLVFCFLGVAISYVAAGRFQRLVSEIRRLLAAAVLFLAMYYLVFMAFLQYESSYSVPWLDKLGYQGTPDAKGSPMIYYNPAFGFWVFLVCCVTLVWLSFRPDLNLLENSIRKIRDWSFEKGKTRS